MDEFIIHESITATHNHEHEHSSQLNTNNEPEHDQDQDQEIESELENNNISTSITSKILLTVVNNKVLIFNLNDIKKLRQLGIIGILIGTLPKAPQQNVFLSVPLELSFFEIIWLIHHNYGLLIDNLKYNQFLLSQSKSTPHDLNKLNKLLIVDQESENKLKKLNLSNDQLQKKLQNLKLQDVNFISTRDFTKTDNNDDEIIPNDLKISINDFIKSQLNLNNDNLENLIANYKSYNRIKLDGFYLLPGLRFGGDFVAYPGDPLRYHAHLIVKVLKLSHDTINCLDLVTGGRLATAVKKAWVVVGELNEKINDETNGERNDDENSNGLINNFTSPSNIVSFSIEWAGFG